MSSQPPYAEPGKARFRKVSELGVERIVIPARKNWFALLFLPVWLTGWTFGGVAAIAQIANQFDAFLAVWLCGWLIGWIFAAGALLWQVAGRETIATQHGDLLLSLSAGGVGRTWWYRGADIRDVRVRAISIFDGFAGGFGPFAGNRLGTVRLDYGSRTIGFAAGLDEAEGRQIVDWLRERIAGSGPTG